MPPVVKERPNFPTEEADQQIRGQLINGQDHPGPFSTFSVTHLKQKPTSPNNETKATGPQTRVQIREILAVDVDGVLFDLDRRFQRPASGPRIPAAS